jgi:hypothetical protein
METINKNIFEMDFHLTEDTLRWLKKNMEEDEVFRTGTINPSMDPNYINNCWKNLAIRLNACGNGPCLSWNAWKKV